MSGACEPLRCRSVGEVCPAGEALAKLRDALGELASVVCSMDGVPLGVVDEIYEACADAGIELSE